MTITVRPASPDDADFIGVLNEEWVEYLRSLGDPEPRGLTAEQYIRDGFGDSPAFKGLVAEIDGVPTGYLLYNHAFDLDRGGRYVSIADLFVPERYRRQGIGRALIEAALGICRRSGAHQLFWSVYVPSDTARRFYEGLGAAYTRDLLYMYLDA